MKDLRTLPFFYQDEAYDVGETRTMKRKCGSGQPTSRRASTHTSRNSRSHSSAQCNALSAKCAEQEASSPRTSRADPEKGGSPWSRESPPWMQSGAGKAKGAGKKGNKGNKGGNSYGPSKGNCHSKGKLHAEVK